MKALLHLHMLQTRQDQLTQQPGPETDPDSAGLQDIPEDEENLEPQV